MACFRSFFSIFLLSFLLKVCSGQSGQTCVDQPFCASPSFRTYCTNPLYKDQFATFCPKTCKTCVDSDSANDARCNSDDNGGCEHLCTIVNDEVKCDCFAGFQLAENGINCVDINECAENPCVSNDFTPTACINRVGNFFCSRQNCSNNEGFLNRYQSDTCCQNVPDASCGRDLSSAEARVVGGKSAAFGGWPWMVYILIDGQILCGGTLISTSWVVTAGHCFREINQNSTITTYFGRLKPARFEPHVQERAVVQIVLHPDWDKENFPYHDIALLRLASPVNITPGVDIACLPNGEKPPVGTQCWVTGFGTTAFRGSAAEDLQEVDLIIQDMDLCKRSYLGTRYPLQDNIMFCAGHAEGGKDSCQGDSGGPLVCQRCDSCQWYLAGIVSFGRGCARPQYYGVYTDVEYYEQWISVQTGVPVNKNRECNGSPVTEWSRWGAWSKCSVTCGTGRRSRNKTCLNGNPGEDGCEGSAQDLETCSNDGCQDEPHWSSWTTWSECTATCGGGNRMRVKRCIDGNIGEPGCQGTPQDLDECNDQDCPVWGEYGSWTSCSASCGEGARSRIRSCVGGNPGDQGCHLGNETEEMQCNERSCPSWGDWNPWSECSVTCNGGLRMSQRACDTFGVADVSCEGDSIRSEICNTQTCPSWSEWMEWSECTRTCNSGSRTRSRTCMNGQINDEGCRGPEDEAELCNTRGCGDWGQWVNWSACSVSCGGGTQMSTRMCAGGVAGEGECIGNAERTRPCASRSCPGWSQYGNWSECSVSCGGGNQTSNRTCIGGLPGEEGCLGEEKRFQKCNTDLCPRWGHWEKMGVCSQTCDKGTINETRNCTYGDVGQDGCLGNSKRTVSCFESPCPSEWSQWSSYSNCSVACGNGTKNRTRVCVGNVSPSCPGNKTEIRLCGDPCVARWGEWQQWSQCSKTCSGALQQRIRECLDGQIGDPGCSPAELQREQRVCNDQSCPDCIDTPGCTPGACASFRTYCPRLCGLCRAFQPWGQWSSCSISCGGGFQIRSRICLSFGFPCFGSSEEMKSCNTEVQCSGFSQWGEWSACNATCNGGSRQRTRMCPPGVDCQPDDYGIFLISTETCQTSPCPGVWGTWGNYSDCTQTCGGGVKTRSRSCIGGVVGGPGCKESNQEESICNSNQCPGKWSDWVLSGLCSVTCGDGLQNETRECIGGVAGGPGCEGLSYRMINCSTSQCIVQWLNWQQWGDCSASCEGGERTRTRVCDNGYPGDEGCSGNATESQSCNTSPCTSSTRCSNFVDMIPNCNSVSSSCSIPEHQQFLSANCRRTCCLASAEPTCQDRPIPNGYNCMYVRMVGWCREPWSPYYCPRTCEYCQ